MSNSSFYCTNDVVFQALFGRGKESITKAMLEGILKIKIHKY